jgi:hypothetical protein
MNEQEVIKMMLESINSDNRAICEQNGMSAEEIDTQIEQSHNSLLFMLSNVYKKLKDAGVIV